MQVHSLKYYEDGGVEHTLNVFVRSAKNGGGLRGKIKGCSVSSRRRLRRFLLENVGVGGCSQWGLTLTVGVKADAPTWRKVWVNYRRFIIHSQIPFVWRVELQKRGVPHLHCVLWGQESTCERCKDKWLDLWGVGDDPSHLEHAVSWRLCDGGWYGYMILHNQKHLDGQGNSWEGRQWGVVNRHLFKGRDRQEWQLNQVEYDHCRKMLNRFYSSRGRVKALPDLASWDHVGGDRFTVAMCVERSHIWYQRQIAKVPF